MTEPLDRQAAERGTPAEVTVTSMPKRPRQHVVEDASRARLRRALPFEWAISDTQHDYGLDARVDVFTDGMATGLAFWVQLKGTDEPDLSRALKVSLNVSALNFMSAQADPVLLVLHHGPSDRLFGQWLHRTQLALRRPDQKTVTVTWASEHELGADSADALAWEVQRFRRIRHAGPGGLGARLQVEAAPAEAATVRLALTRLFRRVGGHMLLTEVEDPDVTIRLSAEALVVDMSLSSINIQMSGGAGLVNPVPNIAVACAHCLETLGRSDVAAALVLAEPRASLLHDEPIALHLAPAFVKAGRLRDAARLLVQYAESDSGPRVFEAALLVLLGAHARDMDVEAAVVGSDLLRVAQALEAADRDDDAAAAYYNAGNFLFGVLDDAVQARDAFERACELRADYLGRPYFLAELAASHFETGSYESAEDLYRRSLDLSNQPHTVGCLADTLAHQGRYADALALLVERAQDLPATWLLKLEALRALVTRTGISQQTRSALETPPAEDVSAHALWQLDALRPEGWLAAARSAGDELEPLLEAFLMVCAFPHDMQPVPWWELLTVAYELDRQDVLVPATLVARRRLGDDFLVGLEHLSASDDPDSVQFAAVLRDHVAASDEPDPAYTVRAVEPDGTFTVHSAEIE